jgi:hypothetical protein
VLNGNELEVCEIKKSYYQNLPGKTENIAKIVGGNK